jgi:hypothetical protein
MAKLPPAMSAALAGMLAILIVVGVAVSLLMFYLSSRLQFVLLDSVLRGDAHIAPIWRRYARATWYWIGLKVAFFCVALVCVSPVLVPMVIRFIHMSRAQHAARDPMSFFAAMLGFLGTIFFIVLLISAAYTLLNDFGLPSMALEGTPLAVTIRRVWGLLRSEPGPVLLYLVMRLVLGLVVSIACIVGLVIALLIALIPFGGVGAILWASLRHSALPGHMLMVVGLSALGLAYGALALLAAVMLFGYVQIFFQAYGLYFLGGRYPLVGAYLNPWLPQPYMYPPPAYGQPSA